MTDRKQGQKDESGDVSPSTPECFGYFMDPIGGSGKCSACSLCLECYTKWKESGEPRRTKGLKRVCTVKWEGPCSQCDGI